MYYSSKRLLPTPKIVAPAVPDTLTTNQYVKVVAQSDSIIHKAKSNLKRDEKKIDTYPIESVIQLQLDLLYGSDTLRREADSLYIQTR